jgi:hypothetical protein
MGTNKQVQTFAEHLASVFQPHSSRNDPEEEEHLILELKSPHQLEAASDDLRYKPSSTTSKLNVPLDMTYRDILPYTKLIA